MPLSFTFDTPGLLARSVSDLAYGFAALDPAGIDPFTLVARGGTRDLSGIRMGVGDAFLWRDCDPGIAEPTQEAVGALVRAGAVACDFKLPEAEAAYDVFLAGGLSAIELRSFLDRELPEWLNQLDPVIAPAVRRTSLVWNRRRQLAAASLHRSRSPPLTPVCKLTSAIPSIYRPKSGFDLQTEFH